MEAFSPGLAAIMTIGFALLRAGEELIRHIAGRRTIDEPQTKLDQVQSDVDDIHGVVMFRDSSGQLRVYGDPVLLAEVQQTRNLVAAIHEVVRELKEELDSVGRDIHDHRVWEETRKWDALETALRMGRKTDDNG